MTRDPVVSSDDKAINFNNLTINNRGLTESEGGFGDALAAAFDAARPATRARTIRLPAAAEIAMEKATEKAIELSVFGRRLLAIRREDRWALFHLRPNGIRYRVPNKQVPATVTEKELEFYLADLCDDWATPRYPRVRRLS